MENNELIARFMGFAYCAKHQYEGWYTNSEFNHRVFCSTEGLKYNTSWDWLMPVVFKIINDVNVYAQTRHDIKNSICADINITYNAVIHFIKWYNTCQPTQ